MARGVRDPGAADGFYAFLYARSLAFDGDLDFRNDYATCGDPYGQGIDRGRGRLDNPAYAGPAVFWTPLVALARITNRPADSSPADVRAGCRGPVARAALVVAVPLGALAIALSFACARRVAGDGAAATAALLYAGASSLPQYASIFVSSSHAYQCFAAALLLWLSFRATDVALEGGLAREAHVRWLLVGLALALCVLQRLSDVVLVVLPATMLANMPGLRREKLVPALSLVAGIALGAGLTLTLYAYLYGSPFVLPQGRHYVFFSHAHPWLLLFAPHGGLLFATPVAYLAFAGLGIALRSPERRRLAIAGAVAIFATIFIASAPLDWHGKATFGARRLVVLVPLFVIFSAIGLQALATAVTRRSARVARALPSLAALAVVALGASVIYKVAGTTTGQTSLEGGFDSPLGELAILPAKAAYAARFGAPMNSFRAATTDRFYRRSYRDLSWEPNVLDLRDPLLREPASGFAYDSNGITVSSDDARLLFLAGWPFATETRLEVRADRPLTFSLALSTTFGGCDLGRHAVAPGDGVVTVPIPEGCFDSGFVQLRFRGARGLSLARIVIDDGRALPPPI